MEKVPFYKWLPYILAMVFIFYAIPPLLEETVFEDFALMIFIPACCLGSGVIFGKINGWVWYYCIVVAMIFAPTLVFNYAQSDIHYIFEYGGLAFMGSLLGYAFHREKYSKEGSYAFNRLSFETAEAAEEACDMLYDNGIRAVEDELSEYDIKKGVKFAVKVPSKQLKKTEELLKDINLPYELL